MQLLTNLSATINCGLKSFLLSHVIQQDFHLLPSAPLQAIKGSCKHKLELEFLEHKFSEQRINYSSKLVLSNRKKTLLFPFICTQTCNHWHNLYLIFSYIKGIEFCFKLCFNLFSENVSIICVCLLWDLAYQKTVLLLCCAQIFFYPFLCVIMSGLLSG